MELLFATANLHKYREVQTILGPSVSIIMPSSLGFEGDIPETGLTFEDNALQKAFFLWEKFHIPCFADDSGLEVDALNGAPGVYSARYAGANGNDRKNVEKLLHALKDSPVRTARFRCVIAFIQQGMPALFEGVVEGLITGEPRGDRGFGYDPVFIPNGYDITFAQMTEEAKNAISHRKRALEKMSLILP
ncbi:MAG: RdgB/HAM1 family non-canonical purine NTP pyrophosphatase [Bacteroidales bacterium]|jgi:XTP/dITP diphosphohydrolase